MATLVLGAVGSAVGGPLGGALGAMLGQSLDQGFFGSGRRGPRLGDLSVQASSYGAAIPKIYGTMRAAGTIVWSTDIQERAADAGGYSYSANFAVALSSRRIKGVRRIWAEGSLLRGVEGDFKVRTDFRLYPGTEDQPVDPLIAAIEGVDRAPAFRGLAVAVFEGLELATYGNRIPSLTFEIEGADEEITVGDLLDEAGLGSSVADVALPVCGFASHGDDLASAVTPLVDTCGLDLVVTGGKIQRIGEGGPIVVRPEELGCSFDTAPAPASEMSIGAEADAPRALAITYYDASRDYQVGQSRLRAEGVGRRERRIELPAVMEAGTAKLLTQQMLDRHWRERQRMILRLPPAYSSLLLGDRLQVSGASEVWRVVRSVFEGFVVTVELVRAERQNGDVAPADGGRSIIQADLPAQPSLVELFELPNDFSAADGQVTVYAAVAGGSSPWRPIPLEVDEGGEISTQSCAPKKAVIGVALGTLAPAGSALLDLKNELTVQVEDADWLQSCDDASLGSGRNLALVGDELIQFGHALPLGQGGFRLSRLLRGRQGTEHASARHVAGERFVLLDPNALAPIHVPAASSPTQVRVGSRGLGDDTGAWQAHVATGLALRPPSPVHLRVEQLPDGAVQIRWVRRSRRGWSWLDHAETPLGESAERYRVRLQGSQSERLFEVSEPILSLRPPDLDLFEPGSVTCSVEQIGDSAISEAVSATFML